MEICIAVADWATGSVTSTPNVPVFPVEMGHPEPVPNVPVDGDVIGVMARRGSGAGVAEWG